MRAPPRPGVLAVATRELRWMRHDRVALLLAFGLPLLGFALLALTFSNAVIRDLRVSVVDADRTPTSMIYVQAVSSAPAVTVAQRSDDLNGAMHAIRSGEAIAAVYIPPDFERDLIARKRPQIVVFYNRQFFTPGNNASSALSAAITAATATLPPTSPVRSAAFAPGSLVVEQYVLSNPALNFAQFLLRAVLPTVLHVVVAIAGGYAVGSEFTTRSQSAWMRAAGGSPLAALVGKLAPLFGIFMLMMVVVAVIIHGVYQITFRGDSVLMGAAACLLVIAYLSIGAMFQLLVRNLALGLSLTAILCSPAFGFAGVGFPLFGMGGFARVWGSMLPLRWYIQILFDQAARGLPTSVSARPFAILGALAVLYFAFAWLRLRAIAKDVRAPEPEPALIVPSGSGVGAAMFAEWRRVLQDRGAFSLIVLAPILYGALYPQPYLGQVLRGIPIAVVDQDGTETSRELVQTLNADEAVSVAVRTNTLAEAQAALARREVFAILGIPRDTEKYVLKGERARIAAYVDFGLFSALQPHVAGHFRGERRGVGRNRGARRALQRKPRPCGADPQLAGRARVGAAVQSDRRLRQLCRAGRLRADRAADASDGLRDAWRRRFPGGRRRGAAPARRRARDPRPVARASLSCTAGPRAVPHHPTAILRLLDARASARSSVDGDPLRAGGELFGPVRQRIFPPPRDARCCCSSRPACRCFSWSACPGRSRPFPTRCARRAAPSRAPRRSTASCASTRWARHCMTCRATGSRYGRSPAPTPCSPCWRRIS